jgi:hypothetical protein
MTCYKSVTDKPCYFISDLYRPGAFKISCVCFFFVFFQKFNWTILKTNQNVLFFLWNSVYHAKKKKSHWYLELILLFTLYYSNERRKSSLLNLESRNEM